MPLLLQALLIAVDICCSQYMLSHTAGQTDTPPISTASQEEEQEGRLKSLPTMLRSQTELGSITLENVSSPKGEIQKERSWVGETVT